MTEYACGHKSKPIIMDDNPLSWCAYLEWVDSTGYNGDKTQCWECFCKASRGEQGNRSLSNIRSGGMASTRQSESGSAPRNQKRADSLKGSFSDAFSSGKMAHPESLKKPIGGWGLDYELGRKKKKEKVR